VEEERKLGYYEGRNPPCKFIWDFWFGLFGWIFGMKKGKKKRREKNRPRVL